ncbi:hypothetical protein HUU62_11015 [Rhodoferax sp. 4810]|nr:hypothetical protein [Rhodoferax jenense]
MRNALYTKAPNANDINCPFHVGPTVSWLDELPPPLQSLVVPPVRFNVHEDYEMQAGHVKGCDAANQPCFCEFHFVLTDLRSDDDDVFYEAPVYTELSTSWRLIDGRWLTCHTTIDRLKHAGLARCYSVTNSMPR